METIGSCIENFQHASDREGEYIRVGSNITNKRCTEEGTLSSGAAASSSKRRKILDKWKGVLVSVSLYFS